METLITLSVLYGLILVTLMAIVVIKGKPIEFTVPEWLIRMQTWLIRWFNIRLAALFLLAMSGCEKHDLPSPVERFGHPNDWVDPNRMEVNRSEKELEIQ